MLTIVVVELPHHEIRLVLQDLLLEQSRFLLGVVSRDPEIQNLDGPEALRVEPSLQMSEIQLFEGKEPLHRDRVADHGNPLHPMRFLDRADVTKSGGIRKTTVVGLEPVEQWGSAGWVTKSSGLDSPRYSARFDAPRAR